MKFENFAIATLCAIVGSAYINPSVQQKEKGGKRENRQRVYPLPNHIWEKGSIVLGNPTDRSIELAIHFNSDAQAKIVYGISNHTQTSLEFSLKAGTPAQIKLSNLTPNSAYSYQLLYKMNGDSTFSPGPTYRFQTQRASGQPFMFMVQGDSHPERAPKMNVPTLYERILQTAADQKPDFFLCLGDDFSVDTLKEWTPQTVESVYKRQVPYLGIVGNSAPIYLVNGNHEQAARANLDGTANSLGVLVQNARNRNFAQPAPDGFYSGDSESVEHIGLLRNYFAWTWGDGLFVTIDPYWHSSIAVDNTAGKGPKNEGGGKKTRDLWNVTLGESQYRWLAKTLSESKAKYKFVFAHHVLGTGRGGIEEAPYYEWGGLDKSGSNSFAAHRPGWELPIHKLFVKTGVTIFFQGHDHIFCHQVLDGVTYQSCPCPADPTNSLINGDAYQTGDKVPGAGLLRVMVGPNEAKIDYVRAIEPTAETDGHKHAEVAFSYTVKPSSKGSVSK